MADEKNQKTGEANKAEEKKIPASARKPGQNYGTTKFQK
jgi:hypothetical protein